jgi:RNA polymerase sigma factor (sigma-70 family)
VAGTIQRVNDLSDQQLLRDYAERQSEAAFAAIVGRYVDLVYSAASRMVCDAHAARDVTQSVFVALAQNAGQLADRPALVAWLHGTARNLAAKTVRSDVRRRAHEQEAAVMNELLSAAPDANWGHIAPHLDEALSELSEPDRDAVLLRYFKNHDLRTVGATLGISDDAAQKRVSRAVERLREFFAKRGVTVGTSGLAVVISANALQAAPVGLGLTISAAAELTGTTLATTPTVTVTKAIAMTALQKTIVTVTIAILAGVGIYETRQASQLRGQVQALEQQQSSWVEQVEQLRPALTDATNLVAGLRDENDRLNQNTIELLRLRGEVTMTRRENAELRKERGLGLESGRAQEEVSTLPAIDAADFTATTYPTGPAGMYTNHYGNPLNYTFPASDATPCSIHGLLNQCMQVSGWHYLIDKEVAAGSVNFGRTNEMNGQEWVEAFENALQFGEPQWWVTDSKKLRKENLVLLRYPQERTVLVLPQDKAAQYK